MYAVLAFMASFALLYFTILIFSGTFVGLVVVGGHLVEICLGREIGGHRPDAPRSGR
ncbi:MAG: hypothetical protein IT305_32405 [Chloroflexi bacterium]|nr:hypothetical protein [Chloroflexota bacterium]